jgi:hypothetical protein
MLTVPVSRRAGEGRHHHVRPEAAHHPHDVLQNRIWEPVAFRFFERPRISEIEGTRKELIGAVDGPGCLQLSRAEQTEGDAELRTQEVLPPLAPGEGEIR